MLKHIALTVLIFVVCNAWAAALSSHRYTAWSIRLRNRFAYAITGIRWFVERAENADSIATRYLRLAKTVAFVVANVMAIIAAIYEFRRV